MIYIISFVVLTSISYWYWRLKYLPTEIAQNAAAIKANGSADDLQRGFHGREVWSRVWPGLACCVVPALPLSFGGGVGGGVLSFAAVAALLLGVFVRDFTPKLNLARIANGDTWLSEWYASPDSKSWPDAAIWKKLRAIDPGSPNNVVQPHANTALKKLLIRTYRWCLVASAALAVAAVVVAARS